MEILFASVHFALDRTSGHSISINTQLEELAKLGWNCRTLTSTVVSGHQPIDHYYTSAGVRRFGEVARSMLLGTNLHGVTHQILPMHDTRRSNVTSDDEQRYFGVLCEMLRTQRPDVLYLYGNRLLEQAILREARRQNIPTAFYLADAGYNDRACFEDAGVIFTPSHALARFYADRLDLATQTIGSFTRPAPQQPSTGEAILFVNPEPGKGVSFLIEIARRCLVELPEARFLVVQSRGTKESAARRFSVDWNTLPNISFLPEQPDLGDAFAASRVLLFPALHFDAAPRLLVEANHVGLPVLASAHGGSAEMLNGAGFLIDVPLSYRSDTTLLPDSDAVTPWINNLKLLFQNQQVYALACSRSTTAASRHNLSRLAVNLSKRLTLLTYRHG